MTSAANSQLEPTISDIEKTVQDGLEALRNAPLSSQIMAALEFLTPSGYRPIAQLEEDGRKKRSTASAANWSPETGEIVIYFERYSKSEAVNAVLPSSPQTREASPTFEKMKWQMSQGLREDPLTIPSAERHAVTRLAIQAGLEEKDVTDSQIEQLCLALSNSEKAGKSFIALKWFRDYALPVTENEWAKSPSLRQAVLSKAIEVGAVLTSTIPNPKAPQHPTTTLKLNRESSYAKSVAPRYQPIRALGGASASEIVLRDRGRL